MSAAARSKPAGPKPAGPKPTSAGPKPAGPKPAGPKPTAAGSKPTGPTRTATSKATTTGPTRTTTSKATTTGPTRTATSKATTSKATTTGPTRTATSKAAGSKPAGPILAADDAIPRRTLKPPSGDLVLEFDEPDKSKRFQPIKGDVCQMTKLMRSLLVDIFESKIVGHTQKLVPAIEVSLSQAAALEGVPVTLSMAEILEDEDLLVLLLPRPTTLLWKGPDPQIVLAGFEEGFLASLTPDQRNVIRLLLKGVSDLREKLKDSARKRLVDAVKGIVLTEKHNPTRSMMRVAREALIEVLEIHYVTA